MGRKHAKRARAAPRDLFWRIFAGSPSPHGELKSTSFQREPRRTFKAAYHHLPRPTSQPHVPASHGGPSRVCPSRGEVSFIARHITSLRIPGTRHRTSHMTASQIVPGAMCLTSQRRPAPRVLAVSEISLDRVCKTKTLAAGSGSPWHRRRAATPQRSE